MVVVITSACTIGRTGHTWCREHTQLMELDLHGEGVRIDVLRRLAEQAMTDLEFRAVAREDLNGALATYGYDLSPNEMDLVLKFRDVLAEAGLDLFLTGNLEDHADELLAAAGLKGR